MMIAGLSTVTPAAGVSADDDWSIIEADAEENTEQEISSASEDDQVIADDWAFSVIEESEPEAAEWQEIEEADALLPDDETELEFLSAAGADKSGTCGGSVTWTLDSAGVLTITGSGPMTDYSSNDVSPFYGRSDIRSVVIADGVETIGSYMFVRCRSLKSVQMPDSVTNIGQNAFWWCTALSDINLSASLTAIGNDAFCQCTVLKGIVIPEGVKVIGDSVFFNCLNLKSIELPDSLERIGSLAFGYCESLERIAIPKGVTAIADSTFNGCESLTQVVIPRSMETIGKYAFASCGSLPEIRIPYGVKSIGMGAFQYCSSLTYIRIPSTVTSMGSSMFDFCSVLSDVYFGGSKEQWDSMAKNLNIQATAKIHYDCELRYTLDDGILVISKWTESELPFEGPEDAPWYEDKDQIRQVIVKGDQAGDIERIDDYAFQDCPQLRSVVLENSLPVIGSRAFEGDTVTVYQNGSMEASPYSIDAFSGVVGWIVWNYDNYDETAEEMVEETSGETGTEASAGKGPHLVLSGMGKMEDMTDETALIAPWASGYRFAQESGSGEPLYEVTISDRITRLGSRTFRSVPDVTVVNVTAQIEECGSCLFAESDNYSGAYAGAEDSRVNIVFSGNAFDFPADAFYRSKLIAYAPPFNATWTEDRMQDYGGKVSWGKIKWEYENSDYVRYNEEGGWEDYAKGQKLLIRGDGPIPDYYDESELPWHPRNKVISEIEIRNGVTEIGDKAFMNMTAVSRVHVGPDIVRIGQDAFDRTGDNGNFFGGLQIVFSGDAPVTVSQNSFGTDELLKEGSQGGDFFRLYPIDIYYLSDSDGWKALAARTWSNSYLAWIAGPPAHVITREEMWGFNNGQFQKYGGYYLSSEDEKRLLSHLNFIEKNAIKKNGKSLRYIVDGKKEEKKDYSPDGGSCTGFSVTEALIYAGQAIPDFLQLPLGSFEKDHPQEKVMSYINFYYLQQFLPSYQKYQADWINKDQAYQLALLETMVKAAQGRHEMVDISFQVEKTGYQRTGHTIMGYAVEEGIFHVKMLNRDYVFDHRILTYDPGEYMNRHTTREGGKTTGNNYHTHAFYYSTGEGYDTCGMWMIPYDYMLYPCSTTNRIHPDDITDIARLLRVGSGYNYLNGVDYETGVVNYREGTVGEVIRTVLPDFDITLNDGTVYAVRNGRLDDTGDDTVVFNGIDNEGSSEEVCVVLKDGVEGYTITSDTGGCFSVYNPAAETMTTASLEKKGELTFRGTGEFAASTAEKGKIYVSITKNDIEREDGTAFLPEHTVSIEAGSVTAMSGEVTDIGFAVSTDGQCSTVVGAENLDTDEIERFRCEAGDHPFLITRSDEDSSRIAVKEDSDGDGDYETVIKGSYDSDTVAEEKITVSKKPSIKKPVAAKNKITVKWSHFRHTKKKAKAIWKKIKKVQVQCATDKGFTNIVKTSAVGKGRTKAVIKGLQKNTTYYLRVRYFDGTGYSKWSGVKKIRTKK